MRGGRAGWTPSTEPLTEKPDDAADGAFIMGARDRPESVAIPAMERDRDDGVFKVMREPSDAVIPALERTMEWFGKVTGGFVPIRPLEISRDILVLI